MLRVLQEDLNASLLYAKNNTEHNLNIEQKNQSTCDLLKTALMNGFDKFYRFLHHSSI